MTMVSIYALIDPRDQRCRYVGKTKLSVEVRLCGHLSDARRRGCRIPRFRWINELLRLGLRPTVKTLEVVDAADWKTAEKMWINEFRHRFHDLLNVTDGGDGADGYKHTEASKAALREKALKRYALTSDFDRARASASIKAALSRPEVKERLSASLKETFARPEIRQRLSVAQLISCARQEVRQKRSAALKGRVFSEEHKAAISVAMTGKKRSQESVARQIEKMRGRKHSEETLLKMRATWARRKAEKESQT